MQVAQASNFKLFKVRRIFKLHNSYNFQTGTSGVLEKVLVRASYYSTVLLILAQWI